MSEKKTIGGIEVTVLSHTETAKVYCKDIMEMAKAADKLSTANARIAELQAALQEIAKGHNCINLPYISRGDCHSDKNCFICIALSALAPGKEEG
jgi:hypothetical protein